MPISGRDASGAAPIVLRRVRVGARRAVGGAWKLASRLWVHGAGGAGDERGGGLALLPARGEDSDREPLERAQEGACAVSLEAGRGKKKRHKSP